MMIFIVHLFTIFQFTNMWSLLVCTRTLTTWVQPESIIDNAGERKEQQCRSNDTMVSHVVSTMNMRPSGSCVADRIDHVDYYYTISRILINGSPGKIWTVKWTVIDHSQKPKMRSQEDSFPIGIWPESW